MSKNLAFLHKEAKLQVRGFFANHLTFVADRTILIDADCLWGLISAGPLGSKGNKRRLAFLAYHVDLHGGKGVYLASLLSPKETYISFIDISNISSLLRDSVKESRIGLSMKLHLEYTAGKTPVTVDGSIDGAQFRAGASGSSKVYQQLVQLLNCLVSLDIPFTLTSEAGGTPVVASPIAPITPVAPPISGIPVTPPVTPGGGTGNGNGKN